ncbi:MAG: hypothetical protein QF815_02470, partial [Candidatus Peribacteraceae bacterium]|nr:hypothetical protein [Candidatus Peribacteraceae bacterium]
SRLEIHFGLYGTLIGSFVSALYSFLMLQDSKKSVVEDIFHHHPHQSESSHNARHQSHRPPPPDSPENHRIHHQ